MKGGSNVVKNACLLALDGDEGKFNFVPDSFSEASNVGGTPMNYWNGDCDPNEGESTTSCAGCMNAKVMAPHQAFDGFGTGTSCSASAVPDDSITGAAWTSLSCYWDTNAPFAVSGSEELSTAAQQAKCICKCNKHACCSKEGYYLDNPVLPGNVFEQSFEMQSVTDCCKHCTEHPQCGSWSYGGGLHAKCTLYSGMPIYKQYRGTSLIGDTVPWKDQIYSGSRQGTAKCW